MSKRMIKFKSELRLLATYQPTTARILFKRAPQESIRAIIDAAWTTLAGKLNLSQKDIDGIRMMQPALWRIALRGQTLDDRRTLLATPSRIKAVRVLCIEKLFLTMKNIALVQEGKHRQMMKIDNRDVLQSIKQPE